MTIITQNGTGPEVGTLTAEEVDLLAEAARLAARIDQLTAELAAETARHAEAERRHAGDIATIGAALLRQAEYRNWCSEYDDVVQSLNRELYMELPVRAQDFDVSVGAQFTFTVRALDEEEAMALAQGIARRIEYMVDDSGEAACNLDPNSEWDIDPA